MLSFKILIFSLLVKFINGLALMGERSDIQPYTPFTPLSHLNKRAEPENCGKNLGPGKYCATFQQQFVMEYKADGYGGLVDSHQSYIYFKVMYDNASNIVYEGDHTHKNWTTRSWGSANLTNTGLIYTEWDLGFGQREAGILIQVYYEAGSMTEEMRNQRTYQSRRPSQLTILYPGDLWIGVGYGDVLPKDRRPRNDSGKGACNVVGDWRGSEVKYDIDPETGRLIGFTVIQKRLVDCWFEYTTRPNYG